VTDMAYEESTNNYVRGMLDPMQFYYYDNGNLVNIPRPTEWVDGQQFTADGTPIPFSQQLIATEVVPRMMTPPEIEQSIYDQALSEAKIQKLEEAALAGEVLKNAWFQGMLDFTSKTKDEGRNKPVKRMENLRGEKPGFVMAEGTNWWSVDEKDPYWQTKEGHKEAMKLYGQKPSWVKESSLEYNPRTGKYDSIKKEEFVDLKPTKRISL